MKFNVERSLKKVAIVLALIISSCTERDQSATGENNAVEMWITTGDKSRLLDHELIKSNVNVEVSEVPVIEVDTTQKFQAIDGFGFALTGGSAYLINQKLTAQQRTGLLKELFTVNGKGIGVSYLRISIGASDLDPQVFSYDDMPSGMTDVPLSHFSLDADKANLIPVLKEIVALSPEIKIMASPWSAPAWMKTNNSPKGGSLKPECYDVYARYFVKYIQGMAGEGITIEAITLQNEPENPKNNPSMLMTAEEQIDFVKNHLGPAFEHAGLKTKIVVFDHNCDHPDYPIKILNDPDARNYIDGSAFHLYVGEIDAMSKVKEVHPDRHLYFTEQWTSPEGTFQGDLRWHTKHLIIGATQNWSRIVLEWNLAADPQFNPHTDDGGCTMCLGALTIGDSVTKNVSYYIIAHASKFVRPGAVRIASTVVEELPNVAFVTPQGKVVLIIVNDGNKEKTFAVSSNDRSIRASLQSGAVATLVW
ncbi:MAG TPA: glycoside hydrolase family 30 beta sandwich domain-containing protein [Cyclobacteriaceae bacterium]|nr:glycoside hydrolase family 30 beta sandwich domain-containing protein [Cyclobacteriaceae bacterium]